MFRHLIDLTGERFGMLAVISRAPNKLASHGRGVATAWTCRCDCGNYKEIRSESLRNGQSKSCGCRVKAILSASRRTHGKSGSRVYRIWKAMINRVTNPKGRDYIKYSALGMSPEFLDFETFYAHVGEPPPGTSLDRKENSKGYVIGNVTWSTAQQQSRNTSRNRILEFNGEKRCVVEWSELLKIPYGRIMNRLNQGWSVERTLSTPERQKPGITPHSMGKQAVRARKRKAAKKAAIKQPWGLQ